MAAPERSFIEDAEQRVKNGRGALENFIEESDFSFRQHTANFGFYDALAQSPQVNRAEDFAGFREPSEQVLEILAAQGTSDAAHRFINPLAVRLDADMPRDIAEARLAAVIRVILRALASGTV